MVLVELVPAFGFQVLGFLLDVLFLVIVAVPLFLELPQVGGRASAVPAAAACAGASASISLPPTS